MSMPKNRVELITYADSLGGDLKALYEILEKHFTGVVGGVHILPFYPSSSDRGFSPLTHMEVDPSFGDWEDIARIGNHFDVTTDLMVNHVSCQSEFFQDYLARGEASPYHKYFIEEKTFFGDRNSNEEDLAALYRPRPETPFREFTFADGSKKKLLCTFSRDQVDLNTDAPEVRDLLRMFISRLADAGVDMIRLDAVGYAVKRAGTSSFMIDETYTFVQWLSERAHSRDVAVLPEVHGRYVLQKRLADTQGTDYVYDFGLPMLVLYTIFFGDTGPLKHWIDIRPKNAVTVLDTHDGIGVVDVEGLLDEEQIERTLALLRVHGGNAMMRATGTNSDNVDIYQMNVTYFSALGESEEGYILARAIQFFLPGIPQVYYVGALAGSNDEEKLAKTGIGRDINRHDYTREEVDEVMRGDVVKKMFALMKFRNSYPAFENGAFSLIPTDDDRLILKWERGEYECELYADFHTYEAHIEYRDRDTGQREKMTICQGVDGKDYFSLVSEEIVGREFGGENS